MSLDEFLDVLEGPETSSIGRIKCEDDYDNISEELLHDFLKSRRFAINSKMSELKHKQPLYFLDLLDELADYAVVNGTQEAMEHIFEIMKPVELSNYAAVVAGKITSKAILTERSLVNCMEFYRIWCKKHSSPGRFGGVFV